MAKLLRIDRKTVARKFLYLSLQAGRYHEKHLTKLSLSEAQFDEMESFEHTRLKPLSIALAVAPDSSNILSVKVSRMPYKGPLARVAYLKYGPRIDERTTGLSQMLIELRQACVPNCALSCDANPRYPSIVKRVLPKATLHPTPNADVHPVRRIANQRRNKNDPLFALNHAAAKIRHDLSRMARRVWTTTKIPERLHAHLMLYIAYNNRYPLFG